VIYDVRGRDEIDQVELIQDGAIVHRSFAQDSVSAPDAHKGPFQVRLEWGWGPWGALALERIADWRMALRIENGRLRRIFPCLQSGPFDENRRHRFKRTGESGLEIVSYTSRKQAYRENPNQSVVLELDGGPDMSIRLDLASPREASVTVGFEELFRGSVNRQVGPFPEESWQWHRLLPLATSSIADRATIDVPSRRSYVYLRVKQRNGHMAWASPVFINYR